MTDRLADPEMQNSTNLRRSKRLSGGADVEMKARSALDDISNRTRRTSRGKSQPSEVSKEHLSNGRPPPVVMTRARAKASKGDDGRAVEGSQPTSRTDVDLTHEEDSVMQPKEASQTASHAQQPRKSSKKQASQTKPTNGVSNSNGYHMSDDDDDDRHTSTETDTDFDFPDEPSQSMSQPTKAAQPQPAPATAQFQQELPQTEDHTSHISLSQDSEKEDEEQPEDRYADDIYQHLLESETKHRPRPNYMEIVQSDVNHTMRSILVDWLIEVSEEYKLTPQTLFLGVHYIDRLLDLVPVNRTKLQLVGITCMLIAAKYEEIYPPSIDEFVYISDSTYTKEEVLRMETVLLNYLSFNLCVPTPWDFSRRYLKAVKVQKNTEVLSDFLAEAFLQEPQYLRARSSAVAAAALYIALYTTGHSAWPLSLQKSSGYTVEALKQTILDMFSVYSRLCGPNTSSNPVSHGLKAVKEKFSQPKFLSVALIAPPASL